MCASHHHIFVYLSINLAFDGNLSIPTFGMTIDKKKMLMLNQWIQWPGRNLTNPTVGVSMHKKQMFVQNIAYMSITLIWVLPTVGVKLHPCGQMDYSFQLLEYWDCSWF